MKTNLASDTHLEGFGFDYAIKRRYDKETFWSDMDKNLASDNDFVSVDFNYDINFRFRLLS